MTDVYPPYDQLDKQAVSHAQSLLALAGKGNQGQHGVLTGHRLTYYLQYLADGADEFHLTAFANENPKVDHMVVVPSIPFWSACSHHCLPFWGVCSVGYIPDKSVIGLSKIPLLVRALAHGFWLQEHLAHSIADHIENAIAPQGVGVYIQAQHTCQLLDLKQPPIPVMKTSILRGILMHGEKAREEFYTLVAQT